VDVTDAVAPMLRNVGMVTAALWSDVDGDGWPDLLLTLEWGDVKYFHNDGGKKFEDWTEKRASPRRAQAGGGRSRRRTSTAMDAPTTWWETWG